MSLDARFELRIDGSLVMEIRVHPKTAADAVADMLEDAAATIREGIDTMMAPGRKTTAESEPQEPLPVEWRYYESAPEEAGNPAKLQFNYTPTHQSTTIH